MISFRPSTTTRPSGRHRARSLGPNITTPGASAAAARCDTPESLPTKHRASRAIPATVPRFKSFSTGKSDSRSVRSIADSAEPRTNTTLDLSNNFLASTMNLSNGQFLAGLPLPGNIPIRFDGSHRNCASASHPAHTRRVDGVAARDASSSDREARQFCPRHQLDRAAAIPLRDHFDHRDHAYEIAKRAGKNHQHAPRGIDGAESRSHQANSIIII